MRNEAAVLGSRLARSFAGQPWLVTGANYVAYAGNGVSLIVSARLLGPSGRGAYSAILAWVVAITGAAGLSMGPAIAQGLARGYQTVHLKRVALRVFLLSTSLAVLLMGALMLFVLSRSVPHALTFMLVIAAIPCLLCWDWCVYFFQGAGLEREYSIARALPACTGCLILILFVLHGLTLDSAVAAFLIANFIAAAWCLRAALRHLPLVGQAGEASPPINLLRFGLRAHAGTLSAIANARLDLLIVSLVAPLASVGAYSVATSLTTPIAVIGSSLGASNYRRVAVSRRQGSQVATVWARFGPPTAVLSIAGAVGSVLIPIAFGSSFSASVAPMAILAIGTAGLGAIQLGSAMLQAKGRPGLASVLFLFAAFLSATTLAYLVPRWGIVGAAISSAGVYMIVGLMFVYTSLWRDAS